MLHESGVSSICVFAYGSNLDPDDYAAYCQKRRLQPGRWERVEVARLPRHRLQFDYWSATRGGGVANVVSDESRSVPGLVLWVDPIALATLDLKEGHPQIYQRYHKELRLASGGSVGAWVYMVHDQHRSRDHVPPTAYYLGLMVQAALRHGFPKWHREQLEQVVPVD